MATAHFYELEDVVATLLYSIQIQDDKTAIAAANELAVSDETATLHQTLWLAWMLGPPSTEHDSAAAKSYADNDYSTLLAILLSTETHLIPLAYKGTTDSKPVRTVIGDLLKKEVTQYKRAEVLTTYAAPFLTGAKGDIVNLLEVYGAPKVLTEALSTSTNTYPISYRILVHACYAAFPSIINQKDKPQRIVLNTTTDFSKFRRTFQINPLALAQWNLKTKPVTKLMGAPTLILDNPAKIWRTVCRTHGVTREGVDLAFSSDELLEAFYLTYFPTDIPDEWSKMERAKSHGIVVPPAKQLNPWTQLFPI